ncbi:siderophore-iron reductase FhuF [Sodalis sp. dw_96]|uniref:siderophore-iron reductase FhuF n=1 Tax=Sodalis sp. dw_96 TaxID=2719794 RepID=UPI001BD3CCC9|nr:siderophore-iron reductase FhuF [Sodalis sp. dw_96]
MNPHENMPGPACAAEIAENFLLTAPDNKKVHSVLDLCAQDTALAVLEPLLRINQGGDRAAVISIWSQWYFALLLAPWTRINMLYDWQLPFLPQSIRFTQSENAVPDRFILADIGRAVPPCEGTARFEELIDRHLAPVCRTLSRLAGIKPGLFWNNAGIRLAHGVDMALQQGADITRAVEFLAMRTLADGTPNRLYQPVREIPQPSGPPKIIRRLCCLRYKLAGLEYCPGCPLVEARQRKAGRCR